MTHSQLSRAAAELALVRQRRELLFWTINMALAMIVFVAMTIAFIVSLVQGAALDASRLAIGAGLTGTSAGGGAVLALLRWRRPPPTP